MLQEERLYVSISKKNINRLELNSTEFFIIIVVIDTFCRPCKHCYRKCKKLENFLKPKLRTLSCGHKRVLH